MLQKTVIAVLDATVKKDWPYQPAPEDDGEDKLHVIEDDPVRYHFHYRILDGDIEGRPAKLKPLRSEERPADGLRQKEEYIHNPEFDHRSVSCLQALCQSEHKVSETGLPVNCKTGESPIALLFQTDSRSI